MKRPVISERMFLYWTDRIPWYLYFIPYYSRYIHGEHVAVGGRAGAYRCGIHTIVYRVVGTAAVFDGHLDSVV